MKLWFNRPFTLRAWQIAAFCVTLVLLAVSGVMAAQARERGASNTPPKMLKAGTVRLTAQQSSDEKVIVCNSTYQVVATAGVNVPAGMKADVIASANAEVSHALGNTDLAFGVFMVDTVSLSPNSFDGMLIVDGAGPKYPTLSQQGMTTSPIGPGNHFLYYKVKCTGGNLSLFDTMLSAVVNLR